MEEKRSGVAGCAGSGWGDLVLSAATAAVVTIKWSGDTRGHSMCVKTGLMCGNSVQMC